MKVSIKNLAVDMEVKTTGVELDVRSPDGKNRHGDLFITKKGLIWCKGKTTRSNGVEIPWKTFIAWAQSQP